MRSQPARVAIDLETTGLHPEQDAIIEIGAVKFAGDEELETFEALVAPGIALPYRIQRLTGISPAKLRGAPPLVTILPRLREFLGDLPLVGHNIPFDVAFLRRVGLARRNPQVDTYELASALLPGLRGYSLGSVAEALGVPSETHHRALADAQLSRHVAVALLRRLEALDTGILEQLEALPAPDDWTLRYFLRQHLRDRRPQVRQPPPAARGAADRRSADRRSAFAGHLTSSLGELLASKMAVNPDVLALAVATEPEPAEAVASDTTAPTPEPATEAPPTAGPPNPALDAGVSACLRDGGVLLVEATTTEEHLAALAAAAMRWVADPQSAEAPGQLLIAAPDGAAMRRLALEVLPAARAGMGIPAARAGVAMLAEEEAYLCLHRWYGMARVALDGPFSRELTRGLSKMIGWTRQTRTGLRADIALPGQEAQAWEQARAGSEFTETKVDCPYRQDGYCFAARAERAAHEARVIVTTHAALAARAAGAESALPQAERVIVLEAALLDEELRRAASATLDIEALGVLLGRLALQEPGGRRVGLLHVAAGRLALGAGPTVGGQQRERGWFEQVARTHQAADRFFAALRDTLEEHAGRSGQGGGDRSSDGVEPRFLRLDAELRRQSSWGAVVVAWQELEQRLAATAKLARETVKALRSAEGSKKPIAADGLAVELLAAAHTLEALAREGAGMVLSNERENEVCWLRVPYPNTHEAGDGGPRRGPPRNHKGGKRGAQNGDERTDSAVPATAGEAPEEPADRGSAQPEPPRLPVLHRAPVAVGPLLAPLAAPGRGLVLSGPALAVAGEFDYLRGTLGLAEGTRALAIAPDCEEQTLLCLPNDVPEPNAQHYQRQLEAMLVGVATALGGRMVVLFPSHAALRVTYQGIRRNLERQDVLVLAQGQDGSTRQLWHSFDAQPRTVLLGAGGFWSGRERGARAPACVVVTRLPFPALSDPLLAARADLWEDQQSQFVVPQAALKVRQALNGLVWSHHERNAVVLFDRRVQSRGYGQTILATLPRCTQREGTAKELTERIADWVDLNP